MTCDPHAKRTVSNSDNPQEVEENKDIVFTYDVEFQVSNHIYLKILSYIFSNPLTRY